MNERESDQWLVVERRFSGISSAKLLHHWTDPQMLVRWWPHRADVELRIGGSLHLAWPASDWHLRGEILEYREGQSLHFTWAWDHLPDEPQREVRVGVRTDDDATVLTIVQGPYGTGIAEDQARQGHLDGWHHFLDRLEAITRSETP
jgi:uncharacterized protein YndB with AHSA1/START domain